MSNLQSRVLVALIGIPIVLFLLWFDTWTRFGMMVAFNSAAAWEWSRMVSKKIEGPTMSIASPVTTAMMCLAWITERWIPGVLLLVGCEVMAAYLLLGFSRVKIDNLFPWIMLHASAPLFLGLWGGMVITLMGSGHGFEVSSRFILVMLAMWVCDTFAYVTGRLLGKHKMAPEISPKKTWEGAFGGTLATIALVVWLGPWAFKTGLAMNVALGVLLSVAGQVGDLFESAVKRWAGSKDASNLLSGHGGVLDRLDSLYMAGPVVAVVLGVAHLGG